MHRELSDAHIMLHAKINIKKTVEHKNRIDLIASL